MMINRELDILDAIEIQNIKRRLESEGVDSNKYFEKDDEQEKSTRGKGPSEDTLMRLYRYGGKQTEKWTLSAVYKSKLCRSLGYKSWADFTKSFSGERIVDCEKIYNIYKLDMSVNQEIMFLDSGTKIQFILGSHSKNFIVEKNDDHAFSYTLLAYSGLNLRRKIGDSFYAPSFLVEESDSLKTSIILIDDGSGWFDEPEQADLKEQKDYCIL